VDKYREMYEKAIDVAKDTLLFRAMIPNGKREILISGTYHIALSSDPDRPIVERLAHGGSHLTCFVGGMFALGAKLFDRKEDLDIAAKLTDGCIWAYESTQSGIMPETFVALPCDDRKSCDWNEMKWWDELDPNPQWRLENYEEQMKVYSSQLEKAKETEPPPLPFNTLGEAFNVVQTPEPKAVVDESKLKSPSNMEKRQLDNALGGGKIAFSHKKIVDAKPAETVATSTKEAESVWTPPSATIDHTPPAIYSPDKPLTHEQYAKEIIEEDRIPPGMIHMRDRRYILR
jgi:mannosyl-oligosaccharide alpha-1,2-mannosidase